MCTSKCSGSCVSLVKEKRLDSKESFMELSNVLDKLSACDTSDAIDKTNFAKEVIILKVEAASLLEEINGHAESVLNGKAISEPNYNPESIFEDFSFKERLHILKQKIYSLSLENPE